MTDNASNLKKALDLNEILEDSLWADNWNNRDILDSDLEEGSTNDENYDEEINDPGFLQSIMEDFSRNLFSSSVMNELPIQGHLKCFAHTLQLAINDALKRDDEAKEFLKYITQIMVFFKRSTRWRDELRKVCKDAPKIFVQTRWNSYLCMIERFQKVG